MKKRLLLLTMLMGAAVMTWSQVVTTITSTTVCTGTTTIDFPVKVSSFTAVGSISLRFTYVNSEITAPSIVYKDPGLDAWGTFLSNTGTAGTIIISAYDPDVTPPVSGLTLSDNTTLFTIRFTIGTIGSSSILAFSENTQGTACEYGGVGPDYIPFTDTPTGTYYINGSITVVADPTAPGLTKNPTDGSVCAGQVLTVSTTAGSGGTGTITDEYRYSTDNGSGWSSWSTSVPSFNAVVGTNLIQGRRTATGTNCDTSPSSEVSWTVVADPVAPTITKNPSDITVCAGQSLTVSTSAGSGGAGTIADEYRYSTNNGSSWSSWGTSVPVFSAVVGTNLVQSRRTATGTGCDASNINEVTWTVVADPVAPAITKNPVAGAVCEGEVLTVNTSAGSGGTGTIADEYRYSTNNGSSWSSWSASVPSFASIPGTNRIQSRRTATGTGCDESAYNEVSWTVHAKKKISGTFNYYRSSGNILLDDGDITVNLYKTSDASHTNLLATTVTNASGYYEFPANCPDCDYDIVATSTHSTAEAINTTDAAQSNYWGPNPYGIEKVRFHAADVSGPDLFIGGLDAARIQQYFVNGTTFDSDPWTFWTTGSVIAHNPVDPEPEFYEYYPSVSLPVGTDITVNMYGLVTGDFNRSFNPNLTKTASESLGIVYSGNITAGPGQELTLPVRIMDNTSIGAISLILDIPADLVEVIDVQIDGTNGLLNWAAIGDELRIGWQSAVPMELKAGENLVYITIRTTAEFTNGKTISLTLAESQLNELADELYNVISDAILSIDVVNASVTGISEDPSATTWFNCYPNPSKDYTIFNYSLPVNGHVNLTINNLSGKQIKVLVDEYQVSGAHMLKVETTDLAAGMYSGVLRFQLQGSEVVKVIKLINNQ